MFYFGDPAETAQMLLDTAKSEGTGPKFPEKDLSEMTETEHRVAFTYYYIAFHDGKRAGVADEVLDVIMAQYDILFEALAKRSEEFRQAVDGNKHQYLTGYNKASKLKYRKLAGLSSAT